MSISRPLLAELDHEARTTRRLLERLPEDRMEWRPHPKSFQLGRLAGHIAELPAWGVETLSRDEMVIEGDFVPPPLPSKAEAVASFAANVAAFRAALQSAGDETLQERWRLRKGDRVMLDLPRAAVLRSMVLSHLIHHRGQLSVYLRLLDVPLPSIYGPTADEPM